MKTFAPRPPLAVPSPSGFQSLCTTVGCTIRWTIMTSVVLAGAGGGGAYWFFTRSDEMVRAEILRQLGARFPGSQFELASANFDLSGRVRAHQLQLTLPDETSPALTVAEVVISLDRDLLYESQTVVIHQLRLIKPRVKIYRDADQNWNWQRLRVEPVEESVLPDVQVEYGSAVVELDANAEISPPPMQCTDIALSAVVVSERGWSITSSARVDDTGPIELQGEWHLDGRPWKCDAEVKGLIIDQALVAKVMTFRPELRRQLKVLNGQIARLVDKSYTPGPTRQSGNRPIRVATTLDTDDIPDLGIQLFTDLKVKLASAPGEPVPRFKMQAQIRNGRISNPVLPLPLQDLTGLLYIDNTQVHLQKLTGHHGKSNVEVTADSSPGEPASIKVSARQIVIDEPLIARVPASLGKLIRSLDLSGVCDVNAELLRNGDSWTPQVDLALTGGHISHEKFPYPVHDVSGTLNWHGEMALLKATGQAGTSNITATGTITHPGPEAEMTIIVQAEDLPIDLALYKACPAIVQQTIRALSLRGSGDAWVKLFKPAGANQKITPQVAIKLRDCSLTYDKFPLRLDRVHGRIIWEGNTTRFEDLRGRHAGAEITGSGSFQRDPSPGRLDLNLTAVGAPFDADLRDALPTYMQQTWNEFSPTGRFDVVSKISWIPGETPVIALPSLKFQHAELTLREFPFPWYNVAGELSYGVDAPDQLNLLQLSAEHDDCRLRGVGTGNCGGTQPWHFHFSEFYVDDLPTTHALRRALPESLRQIFDTLDPAGKISLQGPIAFYGPNGRRNAVAIEWDTQLVFSGAELMAGVPIENMHGKVRINGTWDGAEAVIRQGMLDIGSLEVFDHQLTQIEGPFRYQRGLLNVGSPKVVDGPVQSASNDVGQDQQVCGSAIDGLLTLNAVVNLNDDPSYRLRLRMLGGNLEKYARTYLPGQTQIRGMMNGWIDLQGRGNNANQLRGNGQLAISPAELYELPVFLQIFRVVNPQLLNRADRAAFKEAVFTFGVANERFHFSSISLDGDAIRLVGRGTVRFDGIIGSEGLEFYSTAGRTQRSIPFIGEVVRWMSRGWVGVKVTGDVRDNPRVELRPIPEIDDAMRNFLGIVDPRQMTPQVRGTTPRTIQQTQPVPR